MLIIGRRPLPQGQPMLWLRCCGPARERSRQHELSATDTGCLWFSARNRDQSAGTAAGRHVTPWPNSGSGQPSPRAYVADLWMLHSA